MLRSWQSTLRITRQEARLLVRAHRTDLLKARLDPAPRHPRALLTLLEGLSLWSGYPLLVALSVDDDCHGSPGSTLFGDELWPAESQLVQFDVVHREDHERRLEGLGDFRDVRRRGRP
jgi:hypothetical protein